MPDVSDLPEPEAAVLFQTALVNVSLATWADNKDVVLDLGDRRARAFGTAGPWRYGLDEYDEHAHHLVAIHRDSGEILGAMRLVPGHHIMTQPGHPGFYFYRYWEPRPGSDDFVRSSLELGRVWLDPADTLRFPVLVALWCGLDKYLETDDVLARILGTVSLTDYPPLAVRLIVSYVSRFHPPAQALFRPQYSRVEAPPWADLTSAQEGGLSSLERQLGNLDEHCELPSLLQIYVSEGARLLAAPALDESGRKVLISMELSIEELRPSIDRYRGFLQ